MHVLHALVYKVTEGSGSYSEKSNCSTRTLSLDMCKQSNAALQGYGPSKEFCFKASQTFHPITAKLDQNALSDSCEEKFSAADSHDDVVLVNKRPLNPWAREYRSFHTQKLASYENRNVPKNQKDFVSVNMRPWNPRASEYKSCNTRKIACFEDINVLENVIAPSGGERLPCSHESMPFFLERLRKQDPSSNVTDSEPISFANINGNSNLLNILSYFPHKAPVVCSRKKLLVLDINGILADIVYPPPKGYKADTKIAGRGVFTRPYCADFLNFCLERFNVAIWSSRSRKIIDRLLNYLMGDMKHKLIFCWDLSHCTTSSFRTLENKHKALVFKELRKVWDSYDADHPWEKGFFNESNTFLLDDTPYKALLNPAHTAIFPYSYEFKDIGDNAIGPGGNIRAYLEEIAEADNVQRYIEKHPFGQSAISERSLSWQFYDQVIKEQTAVPAG